MSVLISKPPLFWTISNTHHHHHVLLPIDNFDGYFLIVRAFSDCSFFFCIAKIHLVDPAARTVLFTMAAAGARAQRPVGSAAWIVAEKENMAELVEQELEEVEYPVRHELDWLNEHMAEIFSKGQA